MFRFLLGIFIILHGLVHLWYFTLSQSWLNSNQRWVGRVSPGSYLTFLERQ